MQSETITFLFTDIEGSTRQWEEHPKMMRPAVARHDELMRSAIERHEGHVFKTVGDAFCAAFRTAPDALEAALTAQLVLFAEPWPESIRIRVRIALHTGAAEIRDGDYFGQPLNRVARLLSAGYGGQTLVTLATEELVRDALPPSLTLKLLGDYRLRDLGRPETIFELRHADLPAEFPPLRSLDQFPNNLPRQLTSFIGREKEIGDAKAHLSRTSLLTLTGSGGCGKTRLSLQVAADTLDQYSDGVWLVELAPLSDPTHLPQEVAMALGLSDQAGKTFLQTLTDYLKTKHLLLVLDNCEHLLDGCAQLCHSLLRTCPRVSIIATSREAMGIAGEQTYRVPSLTVPDPKERLTIEQLSQYDAVRLFVERVTSSKPDFKVTNRSVPALAAVCHRLDGIPLAIELAAARVRSLSLDEINARLENRFRLLTGGSKAALPRHQTLRALIDWSYDLLTPQERLLLSRLSVFAGGWTLQAAESVSSGGPIEEWEMLDLLSGLVDKSLVIAETHEAATRYRLLETVKQYAAERLAQSGEVDAVRASHRDYFLALAEDAAPHLTGSEQRKWLQTLADDHDNLRQAIAACLEDVSAAEAGLRLGTALVRYWDVLGHWNEGREHMDAILGRVENPHRTPARARALAAAGELAAYQTDYACAAKLLEDGLEIGRQWEDKPVTAKCLSKLGLVSMMTYDQQTARSRLEESLALFREIEEKAGFADCLHRLGVLDDNLALFAESLKIRRELGDRHGIAESLSSLGDIALRDGDYAEARVLYEESLGIRREVGHKWGVGNSLMALGYLALYQGDFSHARPRFEEALAILRDLGQRLLIPRILIALGELAIFEGDPVAASPLLEEALTLASGAGSEFQAAAARLGLGRVALAQKQDLKSRAFLDKALQLYLDLGSKGGVASVLDAFAELAQQQNQVRRAIRLLGAAAGLRDRFGIWSLPAYQKRSKLYVERARASVGEAEFDLAFQEGQEMSHEEGVEYALESIEEPTLSGS